MQDICNEKYLISLRPLQIFNAGKLPESTSRMSLSRVKYSIGSTTHVEETVYEAASNRREHALVERVAEAGVTVEYDAQEGEGDEGVDVQEHESVDEDPEQRVACSIIQHQQGHSMVFRLGDGGLRGGGQLRDLF